MLVASRAAERPGRKVAQPYPPLRWRRGACTWRKKTPGRRCPKAGRLRLCGG